ncbi:hypothetical protein NVP1244A_140 [Vibrio phage 1.244.A._10N.261.54.C3]|nr:hypothetical protein NVP1244A_140 [Vibrio phage 1.244.A._10N.261.54.C3]AUR98768.1 hypothetical protein NVP1255O_140 [Vibrio phage 1.255.O._10N.286.45.F1]
MICDKCGSSLHACREPHAQQKIRELMEPCSSCKFWEEKFARVKREPQLAFVHMNDHTDDPPVYQLLSFTHPKPNADNRMLGFGGNWWKGMNADGTFRVSNNVWSAGDVPPNLVHLVDPKRIIKTFGFQCNLDPRWYKEVAPTYPLVIWLNSLR